MTTILNSQKVPTVCPECFNSDVKTSDFFQYGNNWKRVCECKNPVCKYTWKEDQSGRLI